MYFKIPAQASVYGCVRFWCSSSITGGMKHRSSLAKQVIPVTMATNHLHEGRSFSPSRLSNVPINAHFLLSTTPKPRTMPAAINQACSFSTASFQACVVDHSMAASRVKFYMLRVTVPNNAHHIKAFLPSFLPVPLSDSTALARDIQYHTQKIWSALTLWTRWP